MNRIEQIAQNIWYITANDFDSSLIRKWNSSGRWWVPTKIGCTSLIGMNTSGEKTRYCGKRK